MSRPQWRGGRVTSSDVRGSGSMPAADKMFA